MTLHRSHANPVQGHQSIGLLKYNLDWKARVGLKGKSLRQLKVARDLHIIVGFFLDPSESGGNNQAHTTLRDLFSMEEVSDSRNSSNSLAVGKKDFSSPREEERKWRTEPKSDGIPFEATQGSGHDDGDALGDVFIWGEGTGDGVLGGGTHRVGSSVGGKIDSLFPKALESAVLLDVQNIACGGRHAALVTKQGEIFSWGEELGGRLGHGVDSNVMLPKLIDALSNTNIELVACGEYHMCVVTLSGDLYTWGDGTYNFGPLGHGNQVSHWVPKRVNGPLEGIHVSSISCGPWHTAVVTSAGELFTFGDGTSGALGHGDRTSVCMPREVESLKVLRTVRAACGVWHTAAIVEVMVGNSSSSNCSSGKLFTWGNGDKGGLGHGDKEAKLVPTCVADLVEPNFCQVACGHSLTVALTTSGHVYTMGSPVYGQLGNPQADGKVPARVEGKLARSFVEEIACGAYHVAVLTSRTEVFTWGKGANGRLGHGDMIDRNLPTLVEALKAKQVKSIACGTNFTSAFCLHKWVSGIDQSKCSGCHLPFNFKRKRHNCYSCGLVFCRSCSSKKSLKASMAPNPNKRYRVCDNCYNKLRKAMETDASSHSSVTRRGSITNGFIDKDQKLDSRSRAQLARVSSMEPLKQKLEFNSSRLSPVPNGSSVFGLSKKFFSATSSVAKRPSPPSSSTPTPTLGGLASPQIVVDNANRTNDGLSQVVIKLRQQVENLTRKTQLQEIELERTRKQLREAIAIAGEETQKCKAAKEVIKSLTAQLKDMAERLPVGAARSIKLPSLGSDIVCSDVSNPSIDRLKGQALCQLHSKGSTTTSKHTSLPWGANDLKRVRFSPKRFSEKQAEQWWADNRARVYEQYNVRMMDKSSVGVGSSSDGQTLGLEFLASIFFGLERKQGEEYEVGSKALGIRKGNYKGLI
ncbi:hypothetical protein UlMin_001861 [Ulmus minor]